MKYGSSKLIERTVGGLHEGLERALFAEDTAARRGLMQTVDPRAKLAGFFSLMLAASISARLWVIWLLFSFAVLIGVCSRVPVAALATRIWPGVFVFTGSIVLPAVFLTSGHTIFWLPVLHWPVSRQGLISAAYVLSRAETAATLGFILILTTPWMHILKALRALRAPAVFVVILGMTTRYIFLLLETAGQMFESQRSRMVGRLEAAERRRIATATAGVLLNKTLQLSHEVYSAMQSRGFTGEIYLVDEFRMMRRDWVALALFTTLSVAAIWAGR